MLTPQSLHDLFERLGTPDPGRHLVERARKEAPVREVRSHLGNVITRYASHKMARAIATESRTCEYPAVITYERDLKVLEYYPQPVKLDVMFSDGGATRPYRLQHTPDFLLLTEEGIWIEEWREEERLQGLARKYPVRYLRTEEGWRFPEMEAYLAEMGLGYRLRSANEHPKQYIRNLEFLGDYLTPGIPALEAWKLRALRSVFEQEAVISLSWLLAGRPMFDGTWEAGLERGPGEGEDLEQLGSVADLVYQAIAEGHLVVDLKHQELGDTHRVLVYRDEASLQLHRRIEDAAAMPRLESRAADIEVGTEVVFEGNPYKVILVGQTSAVLKGDAGTSEVELEVLKTLHAQGRFEVRSSSTLETNAVAALNALSPTAAEVVIQRQEWLERAATNPESVPRSKRTLDRWRKAMREAGDDLVAQHVALAQKYDRCGSRERKLSQEQIDLIQKVAKEKFNTPEGITNKVAYKHLIKECDEAGIRPCSEKTFNKELASLKSTKARKGKRFAYQTEPIVWYLKLEESIHGVRPFQIVHIDHTELDVQLRNSSNGKPLGRPWLSLAMDAESRAVLGFYLTFEPPSYRSCMMVLRDLVRRHGRMPEMLVVDNGKEFHSRAMQRACQLYGCSLRYRPAAKARFGSVLERLFGTVNSQFIHLLEGNTQIMKQARMVSKSVRPENFVTWSLPTLHLAMEEYFTKIYGTENHPAHGEEPIRYLQHRMVETGERRRRLVRFDDTFRIETCPSPKDGDSRQVDPSRGVKVTNFWYWNDVFRKPGMGKKTVEVRIDPGEAWIVYVLVENRWYRCISKLAGKVRNLTEVELRYAYEEIQKRFGTPKKALSPERVAEHLRILDAKAIDAKLSAQQAEAKAIYEPLGMATATQGKAREVFSGAPGQEDGAVVPPSAIKQSAQPPSPTTSKPAPGPRPKVVRTPKPVPREQPKSTFSTGPALLRDPLSSNTDSEPSKEMPYELELF